jgi:hypothetical protein
VDDRPRQFERIYILSKRGGGVRVRVGIKGGGVVVGSVLFFWGFCFII